MEFQQLMPLVRISHLEELIFEDSSLLLLLLLLLLITINYYYYYYYPLLLLLLLIILLFWAALSCGFSVVWVFWPSGLFLSVRVLLSFVFGILVPCRLVVCLFGGLVIAYFTSVQTCEVGRMLRNLAHYFHAVSSL